MLAQFLERGEGLVELAEVGGLEAMKEGEGARVVGEVLEGDGGDDGSSGEGRVGFGLAGHFELEAGGFDAPEAEESPAGGDHDLDQEGFGGVSGLELEEEGGGEVVEAVGGLAVEEDGGGEGGVGGGGFEGGGWGGEGFTLGCHDALRVSGGGEGGRGVKALRR
ncbi:MAG TPA: hypothetical protein VGN17_31120 [Bryobacteraceae bacterium]